jgi:hypothetical protein
MERRPPGGGERRLRDAALPCARPLAAREHAACNARSFRVQVLKRDRR